MNSTFTPVSPRVAAILLSGFVAIYGALIAPPARADTVVADEAADLCAETAEPCVVAQEVSVAAGARLDFGLRTLRVQGAGVLDFGASSATIECGRFEAAASGAALRLRGSTASGSAGGLVTVLARRRCSLLPSLACLADADCSTAAAGSCSGGDGGVTIDTGVSANAESPGRLVIQAAGDIALSKSVSMAGSTTSSDGGALELESKGGSIRVAGTVDVGGGAQASGGEISLIAAGDIVVTEPLLATGGDYDGGTVFLQADRDVLVHADLRVESLGGAGFGGEIDVVAGRDLDVSGGGASDWLLLAADGHQSSENYGGDGGTVALDAGRNLSVSRYVRISSNGAAPDGFGDTVSFSAGGDVAIDGSIDARGRGSLGGGGIVEIDSDGDVRIGASAVFDLQGSAAGGDFDVVCAGNLDCAAAIDASAASDGVGGRILASAGGDAVVSGPWKTAGAESRFSVGELMLEGCHLRVAAAWVNAAAAGRNRIVARESITVLESASIAASGSGATNSLRIRSAAKPPRVLGSIAPAPIVSVDASMQGCPLCGNAEVDQGETCDDGNLTGGDGCAATCEHEGCAGDCDDGNPCTQDLCSASGCVFEPWQGGCDDGTFCNGTDYCVGGSCAGHRGDPCAGGEQCSDICDEGRRSCHTAAGSACSDDGNPCTDDACDGAGLCAHPPNRAPCDDARWCNGADACRDGSCSVHAGDPCADGRDCSGRCEEPSGSCRFEPSQGCRDDGNPCTTDRCTAPGLCAHEPVEADCDDGDFCTTDESCSAGACEVTPAAALLPALVKVQIGSAGADDRVAVKAVFDASWLAASPPDTNLRVVLSDEHSSPLLDRTLPAGSFAGRDGDWSFQQGDGRDAGAITSASIRWRRRGVGRVKIAVEAADLFPAALPLVLRVALLLGDEPASAPCASSPLLACERGRAKLRCAALSERQQARQARRDDKPAGQG